MTLYTLRRFSSEKKLLISDPGIGQAILPQTGWLSMFAHRSVQILLLKRRFSKALFQAEISDHKSQVRWKQEKQSLYNK